MPTTRIERDLVERTGNGTIMIVVSTFASSEAMKQMLDMGLEDGMRQAIGQIDGVLEDVG
ncbi:MAG: hypothetical protein NVS3B21_31090 [Acidimicrobiales bacterium]